MGPGSGLEILAHRGLHNTEGVTENSRQAVADAFNADVDGIEVDLQLLGDGTIVLHHDSTIKTDQYHPLGALSYPEFKELVDFTPLSLPGLLEMNWQGKRVVLECKPNRNHLSLVRRLLLTIPPENHSSKLTLSSYDWDILLALSHRSQFNLAPVITSYSGETAKHLDESVWSELHLGLSLTTDPRTVELAEEHDAVFWTVNSSNDWEKLERLGIKGIMTDNPDAF